MVVTCDGGTQQPWPPNLSQFNRTLQIIDSSTNDPSGWNPHTIIVRDGHSVRAETRTRSNAGGVTVYTHFQKHPSLGLSLEAFVTTVTQTAPGFADVVTKYKTWFVIGGEMKELEIGVGRILYSDCKVK
jgi:hypothetical protein